jgi:hypothetical protein
VVVDNLDGMRAVCFPAKANAPLIVDPNRKLTFAVTSQAFESVPGNRSKCRIDFDSEASHGREFLAFSSTTGFGSARSDESGG